MVNAVHLCNDPIPRIEISFLFVDRDNVITIRLPKPQFSVTSISNRRMTLLAMNSRDFPIRKPLLGLNLDCDLAEPHRVFLGRVLRATLFIRSFIRSLMVANSRSVKGLRFADWGGIR